MTLALHLGLHWGMFMALAGKALRLRNLNHSVAGLRQVYFVDRSDCTA